MSEAPPSFFCQGDVHTSLPTCSRTAHYIMYYPLPASALSLLVCTARSVFSPTLADPTLPYPTLIYTTRPVDLTRPSSTLQGYLTHNEHPPRRTLQ